MATTKSPSREVFADSAGWGNLFDAGEPYHAAAARLYRGIEQQAGRLVTTNYVIAETVSLMISPLRMPSATRIAFINDLMASPRVEIVHVDPTLHAVAWQLLEQRQDKEWSLVDCVSFVVMQQRSITDALTTDHHFEQAGFVRLLA